MSDFPRMLTEPGHVEPVPRRIRATVGGRTVVDTTHALYVWDWPNYPRFALPHSDVHVPATSYDGQDPRLHGTVHVPWGSVDAWYEEDEEVFVHPRNPYSRVDALRSSRHVTVELDGVLLAESRSPVLVFETGLPTRYYLPRPDVRFEHLTPSATVTACPYKGRTSGYWSTPTQQDLAWAYDFPTRELLPVAGLVCFYNERVDLTVDGVLLDRPVTHFS